MKIALSVVALAIAGAVAAALAGSSSWHRATRSAMASLQPSSSSPALFDAASLAALPPPAARYLQAAIPSGHPMVRAAIARQEAEFFINGGWHPLTATQHFVVTPPGFVWDARIDMAPLMAVRVRDAYVDRRAMMQASMHGIYTLANQVDQPELNAGALQRFLGESIWFPTALLPSAAVTWSARDDRSASVSLADGDTIVTLLFEFGDSGMPVRITGHRFKEDGGRYSMQPWEINCGEVAMRDRMAIPLRCEVSWIVDGVKQPYWRGRISSIEYQYDLME
jgi:hypothetical protein